MLRGPPRDGTFIVVVVHADPQCPESKHMERAERGACGDDLLHIQNTEVREDPRFQDKGTWRRWMGVREWIETFQGETCLRNRGFKNQTARKSADQ